MKNLSRIFTAVIIFASFSILISRGWRSSQIPNGTKFDCATCHVSPGGGGPRNSFGKDVESRVSPGGQQDFWGSSLASLDSDGDGFSNGRELGDQTGSWRPGQPNPGNIANVSNPGDASSKPSTTDVANFEIPIEYKLLNNYPNPFNPATTIAFEIPQSENVTLKIYSMDGQLVKTLADGNYPAGKFQKVWNGKNEAGNNVSSGIYLYRLTAGNFNSSARMILMK